MTMCDLRLEHVTAHGSPESLGRMQGLALGDRVQRFVAQRLQALDVYMAEVGRHGRASFRAVAMRSLACYADWDPDGYREHMALAESACVDPVDLFGTTNMTDIRDVMLCREDDHAAVPDDEGCTAFQLPGRLTRDGRVMAGQTWDLNVGDVAYVVAVHRRPDAGPETWSITCAGCLTLMGMNAAGVSVGTTNLKTTDARDGIPYLALLHRALRCTRQTEALDLIERAPRSGAHTYWAADAEGAALLACSATRAMRHVLHDDAICHTNHCLDASLEELEAEVPTASSRHRLDRIRTLCAAGRHDVESVKAMLADRDAAPDSINRYAEDGKPIGTNACLITVPSARELHACRGPADRGAWERLAFTAARS